MASTPVALGAIKEFDPDVDRITPYLERVALFLTANGVGEDAEVPAFLSIIQVLNVYKKWLGHTSKDTLTHPNYTKEIGGVARKLHTSAETRERLLPTTPWDTSLYQQTHTEYVITNTFCNVAMPTTHCIQYY